MLSACAGTAQSSRASQCKAWVAALVVSPRGRQTLWRNAKHWLEIGEQYIWTPQPQWFVEQVKRNPENHFAHPQVLNNLHLAKQKATDAAMPALPAPPTLARTLALAPVSATSDLMPGLASLLDDKRPSTAGSMPSSLPPCAAFSRARSTRTY